MRPTRSPHRSSRRAAPTTGSSRSAGAARRRKSSTLLRRLDRVRTVVITGVPTSPAVEIASDAVDPRVRGRTLGRADAFRDVDARHVARPPRPRARAGDRRRGASARRAGPGGRRRPRALRVPRARVERRHRRGSGAQAPGGDALVHRGVPRDGISTRPDQHRRPADARVGDRHARSLDRRRRARRAAPPCARRRSTRWPSWCVCTGSRSPSPSGAGSTPTTRST